MKPVRILVDSTVDLPERCRAQVRAVPLTVHFGDEELIDGVTIDRRRFYERLIESDVLPTTSQATPAAFVKEFEAVRQAGESAVVITISAELSGTYQSACIAAADYEDIYVVDSRSAAIGSGILAELALEWAADGMAAVQLFGLAQVSYSGTAPAVGWATLAGDGKGAVKTVTSGGVKLLVLSVDTAAKTAVIRL